MATTTATTTTADQLRWLRQDVEQITNAIVTANQRALSRLRDLADAIDQIEATS